LTFPSRKLKSRCIYGKNIKNSKINKKPKFSNELKIDVLSVEEKEDILKNLAYVEFVLRNGNVENCRSKESSW
jgi:hypothetical protein